MIKEITTHFLPTFMPEEPYFWAFSLVILVLDVEFTFVSLFFKRYPKDIQKMRNLYTICFFKLSIII